MDFDGKETAVINALNATLKPVDPSSIQITSYTVGAPVRIPVCLHTQHAVKRAVRSIESLFETANVLVYFV